MPWKILSLIVGWCLMCWIARWDLPIRFLNPWTYLFNRYILTTIKPATGWSLLLWNPVPEILAVSAVFFALLQVFALRNSGWNFHTLQIPFIIVLGFALSGTVISVVGRARERSYRKRYPTNQDDRHV